MSSRSSEFLLSKDFEELRQVFLGYKAKAKFRGSCMLTHLEPTKRGGYAQASLQHSGQQVKFCLHVLSAFIAHGRLPGPGEDASHLCGNAKCINPAHLVIEPKSVNQSRKNCKGAVVCDHCKHVVSVCHHNPACINPHLN